MQYLIIPKEGQPFLTKWYDYNNNYTEGMMVYDLDNFCYTTDGKTWNDLPIDHL